MQVDQFGGADMEWTKNRTERVAVTMHGFGSSSADDDDEMINCGVDELGAIAALLQRCSLAPPRAAAPVPHLAAPRPAIFEPLAGAWAPQPNGAGDQLPRFPSQREMRLRAHARCAALRTGNKEPPSIRKAHKAFKRQEAREARRSLRVVHPRRLWCRSPTDMAVSPNYDTGAPHFFFGASSLCH